VPLFEARWRLGPSAIRPRPSARRSRFLLDAPSSFCAFEALSTVGARDAVGALVLISCACAARGVSGRSLAFGDTRDLPPGGGGTPVVGCVSVLARRGSR